MNKKLQEMWAAAYEIPVRAYVPANTVLVQLDPEEHELNYYEAEVSEYWKGSSRHAPVRSADPLPDPADTGTLTVHSDDGVIVLVDTYDDRCYDLSSNQACNLARMLTEAIDE